MVPIVYLLLVYLVTAEGEDKTTLLTKHGFLLKDQGKVYLDTNEAYLSVFVNVALPQFQYSGVNEGCFKHFTCGNERKSTENCDNSNFSGALRAQNLTMDATTKKILEFNKLTNSDLRRSKRSIAGFLGLGLGLFNMVFSGISNARISNHLNNIEGKFNAFKLKQDYVNKRLVSIQEDTIHVIDHDLNCLRLSSKIWIVP